MNLLILCTAMGLIITNFALLSGAKFANDRDYMKEFSSEDLEYIKALDDENPEEEFLVSFPFATDADRRKERAEENSPADTSTSRRLLNERSAGRYCGELSSKVLRAEVRAINGEYLLLRNMYWDDSLKRMIVFGFKTTYKNRDGTFKSFIRVDPNIHERPQQFMYFVRYAYKRGIEMDHVEVFNPDNMEYIASLNLSACVPPNSVLLGRLTKTSHGVASGDITLLSSNVMSIKDLVLPTDKEFIYLWAGYGAVQERKGYIIPVDGSTDPIRSYNMKKMVVELPKNGTFYDVDYIAVFTYKIHDSLGHVHLNRNLWRSDLLPPSWTESFVPIEHHSR